MYTTIENKKIHYETYGKGEPIVFVHGWGGNISSLRKLAKLASRNFRAVLFDLPGFGRSDNPDPEWGVEEYATLVLAIFKKLKLKDPVYFGHSFGGSLGIYISAKQPDAIKQLILCASSYKRRNKKSRTVVKIKQFITGYLPFLTEVMVFLRPYLYKLFFRNSDLAKYPHLESNFRKIVTHDLSPLLPEIKKKTLIIWGERDKYTPLDLAHELRDTIADSQLVVFPNKSHNLPIRYPAEVYKEMKKFLGVTAQKKEKKPAL